MPVTDDAIADDDDGTTPPATVAADLLHRDGASPGGDGTRWRWWAGNHEDGVPKSEDSSAIELQLYEATCRRHARWQGLPRPLVRRSFNQPYKL